MNHLGNAKCNCPYAVHGLESPAGLQARSAASAAAGARGITARWAAGLEGKARGGMPA